MSWSTCGSRVGSKSPLGGATTAGPARPRVSSRRLERFCARLSRLGRRRVSEAASGSAYPRASTSWERAAPRKVSRTVVAPGLLGLAGHLRQRCRGRGRRGRGRGLVAGPRVAAPSVRTAEPRETGGLPWPKSSRASSTAGSTSQETLWVGAVAPKSASRVSRPSGPVRPTQRAGPFRLPSAARRARSRSGSTTETGTVRVRARSAVTRGMKVRARPSATRSRPSGLAPRACTPIQ